MTNWALLGLIFFAANLPWFSNKLFYLIPLNSSHQLAKSKHLGWCLLELLALYFAAGAVAWYAERATFGQVSPQGWEFYAVTGCLFLVFAFPGFVYKVLWKRAF
ncbi:MAG: DUF2818 family protein [Methylotenera sp.]|nr:DUF2818 family protein [Methylotenera sp.]MDO9232169.1 DUF2818 family protein [Methylotenera sp.]MDO9388674.1 DUF2818 family protein [Methylotenera sp.]MDP2101129.1 DUF2818 family protein [Methylotenera sp.]MDP2280311.1 DUF2818 family protein [Methylotenera sp.]